MKNTKVKKTERGLYPTGSTAAGSLYPLCKTAALKQILAAALDTISVDTIRQASDRASGWLKELGEDVPDGGQTHARLPSARVIS